MASTAQPELTCKGLVELVTDYLEGALLPVDRARFEGHLAGCKPCRIYVEQMRQTIGALGHLPSEDISDHAMQVLLDHFRRGL